MRKEFLCVYGEKREKTEVAVVGFGSLDGVFGAHEFARLPTARCPDERTKPKSYDPGVTGSLGLADCRLLTNTDLRQIEETPGTLAPHACSVCLRRYPQCWSASQGRRPVTRWKTSGRTSPRIPPCLGTCDRGYVLCPAYIGASGAVSQSESSDRITVELIAALTSVALRRDNYAAAWVHVFKMFLKCF